MIQKKWITFLLTLLMIISSSGISIPVHAQDVEKSGFKLIKEYDKSENAVIIKGDSSQIESGVVIESVTTPDETVLDVDNVNFVVEENGVYDFKVNYQKMTETEEGSTVEDKKETISVEVTEIQSLQESTNVNNYSVSNLTEYKEVLEKIANQEENEATIILCADIENNSSKFAGINGKHITMKSEGDNKFSISLASELLGDVTFDNVIAKGDTLYCNGKKTIFTEKSTLYLSRTLYGGGCCQTVDRTYVSIRGDGTINSSGSENVVVGGSYKGSVEGDVYIEIIGNINFNSSTGGHYITGANKTTAYGGDQYNGEPVYVGGNVTLILDTNPETQTTSHSVSGTHSSHIRGNVDVIVKAGKYQGIDAQRGDAELSDIDGDVHIVAGAPEYENTDRIFRSVYNWGIYGAGEQIMTYGEEFKVGGNITIDTYENLWGWDKGSSIPSDIPEIVGAHNSEVEGSITINAHGSHMANIIGVDDETVGSAQGNNEFASNVNNVTINAEDIELYEENGKGSIIGSWIENGIILGKLEINVDSGSLYSIHANEDVLPAKNSTINITGSPVFRYGVWGINKKNNNDDSVINVYDCNTTIPFIYYATQVNIYDHSTVIIGGNYKPFYYIDDLNIMGESKLTTVNKETIVKGNVSLDNGQWNTKGKTYIYGNTKLISSTFNNEENFYIYDYGIELNNSEWIANKYVYIDKNVNSSESHLVFNNFFAFGYEFKDVNNVDVMLKSKDDEIVVLKSGYTAKIYGSVDLQGSDLSLLSPVRVSGNWSGGNSLLRLPVANPNNYPQTTIPLRIDGVASGQCDVLIVENNNYQKVAMPEVGQNYIIGLAPNGTEADNPIEATFVLKNAEALQEGLYLKRIKDPKDETKNYMWQVAKKTEVTWYYEVYYQNPDGSYSKWKNAQGGQANPDSLVSISHKSFDGTDLGRGEVFGEHYLFDEENTNNRLSAKAGEATQNNPLKIYYKCTPHTVTYRYEGDVPSSVTNPSATQSWYSAKVEMPEVKKVVGYEFLGWKVISPSGITIVDNKITMPNDDVIVEGIWKSKTHNVTYKFISGTNGKDLPEGVINQKPSNGTVKHGETASPSKNTFNDVTDGDGKWIFKGWDKDKVENVTSDITFTGTWEYVSNKHKVTYEFKKEGTEKEFPASITSQLPAEQEYRNGEMVDIPTLPATSITEEDGVWIFKGWDKSDFTMGTEDVTVTGTWKFEKNQYKVDYEFRSTTEKELISDIKDLLPSSHMIEHGEMVKPSTDSFTSMIDMENDGIWTFQGWSPSQVEEAKADVTFVGTWKFEANRHKVEYKFESVTGQELPDAVNALLPTDDSGYIKGDSVTLATLSQTSIDAGNGVWTFEGWDKSDFVMGTQNVIVTGTWKFEEYRYDVDYEFRSSDEDRQLPESIKNKLPAKQEDAIEYGTDALPSVDTFADEEDANNDGVWTFKGWNPSKVENVTSNVTFVGTWEFVPNTYKVIYEFVSGTAGKQLPEAVERLCPEDDASYITGDRVKAKAVSNDFIAVDDGAWVFAHEQGTGWDKSEATVNKGNVTFTGTWKFIENAYLVDYIFISEDGKTLPEGVQDKLPGGYVIKHGDTAEVKDSGFTNVEETKGVWVFVGWDREKIEKVTDNVTFTGTWKYYEKQEVVAQNLVAYEGGLGSNHSETTGDALPEPQWKRQIGDYEVTVDGKKWNIEEQGLPFAWEYRDEEGNRVTESATAGVYGLYAYPLKGYEGKNVIINDKILVLPEEGIKVSEVSVRDVTDNDNADSLSTETFKNVYGYESPKDEENRNILESLIGKIRGLFKSDSALSGEFNEDGMHDEDCDDSKAHVHVPAETQFLKNGNKDMPVNENAKIGLLWDDFLPEALGKYTDIFDQKSIEEINAVDEELFDETKEMEHAYKYLDLVDMNDGNVWVSTDGKEATVYIPYPAGVDASDSIAITYFEGLTRDYTIDMENANLKEEILKSEVHVMEITKTDTGILFKVPSKEFGAFEMTWQVNDHGVSYEFISGTEGMTLPESVTSLKPTDAQRYKTGAEVKAIEPSKTEVKVEGGSWLFRGYDKSEIENIQEDVVFVGTWEFVSSKKENTPPEIETEDKILNVGDEFDPRKDVTANDKEDGDITEKIEILENNVDTTKVGTYQVTYKVTDSEGASTIKSIKVIVKDKDADIPQNNDRPEEEQGQTPDKTEEVKEPVQEEATEEVKTNDETNMKVWIASGLLAAMSMLVIMKTGKKKKEKNN